MTTRLIWLFAIACGEQAAPKDPVENRGSTAPLRAPAPTTRDGAGKCTPQPQAGEACSPSDSWCVVSWGSPGGSSSALWCRDGKWVMEEEQNLR